MPTGLWSWHADVAAARRRLFDRTPAATTTIIEVGCLVVLGATAALLSEVDFLKRMPGHAILRSALPFAFGLALVPRKGSGTMLGLSALATMFGRRLMTGEGGVGSFVSLALLGPLLDLLLLQATRPVGIYAAIIGASLIANLSALATQAGIKIYSPSGKPLSVWIQTAAWTYPLFALIAGVLSAGIFFGFRRSQDGRTQP